MNRKHIVLSFLLLLSLNIGIPAKASLSSFLNKFNIFKTDYYEDDKYVLLYNSFNRSSLLDMKGNSLKGWDTMTKRAKLLDTCNLMFIKDHFDHSIREISENGNVAWEFEAPGPVHHDFEISDDGNIHMFYRTTMPENVVIDNGCNNDEVLAEAYIEVDREKNVQNEIFFHDYFMKALNHDKCHKKRKERMKNSGYDHRLDWIHPNSLHILKANKWSKDGFEEFKAGNILFCAHHLNKIFIIDSDLKKVVWEYKDDDLKLEGPHEAKMIPPGYPGAGNILIFDNGNRRKYSRIIEVNPISKKIVWQYTDTIKKNFYTAHSGSHQRLKNGDTFISEDNNGESFIVNKSGKVVWKYSKKNASTRRSKLYLRKDLAHCL